MTTMVVRLNPCEGTVMPKFGFDLADSKVPTLVRRVFRPERIENGLEGTFEPAGWK